MTPSTPNAPLVRVPTLTPYLLLPQGVDEETEKALISRLLDHHERQGVQGMMVGALSGDAQAPELRVRGRLFRRVAAQARGRFYLVADVNAQDRAQILKLARDAAAAGYNALSLFAPTGPQSSAAEARDDLRAILDQATLPVHLSVLDADLGGPRQSALLRLCEIDQVQAITLYSRDISLFERISYHKPSLTLYCGFEEVLLPALSVGAAGACGPLAGVLAPLLHEIQAAFQGGETRRALAAQRHIGNFVGVAAEIGVAAASRGWMTLLGVESAPCRGENGCLTPSEWRALQRCLDGLDGVAQAA
jgi:dihydrodipicolinate synthase/N-acetylneuraminate lyase